MDCLPDLTHGCLAPPSTTTADQSEGSGPDKSKRASRISKIAVQEDSTSGRQNPKADDKYVILIVLCSVDFGCGKVLDGIPLSTSLEGPGHRRQLSRSHRTVNP